MAIAELTENVWWSNMNGPVEAVGRYKSILDLSGGYTKDNQHYRLSQIDGGAAVFRLPVFEDNPVDIHYLHVLSSIETALRYGGLFPLLVHCMAGQCRAPITAVFFAWRPRGTVQALEELLTRMRQLGCLNGGVDENRLYHKTLRETIRSLSINENTEVQK